MKTHELYFHNSFVGRAVCYKAEKSDRVIVDLDVQGDGGVITVLPPDCRPRERIIDGSVCIEIDGRVSRINTGYARSVKRIQFHTGDGDAR